MGKLTFNHLVKAAELPALREAVAEMQHDAQAPGPEIIAEQPWETLAGVPYVLVNLAVQNNVQSFLLGVYWGAKLKGGPANGS